MKCPRCAVWTRTLETRTNPQGMRRRYECANGHRFTTQETPVGGAAPRAWLLNVKTTTSKDNK